MLGGVLCRLGPTGINDHERASFAQRLESAGEVRNSEQTAVGDVRICAQHQQIVGAVDVWQWEHVWPAPHEPGADMFGHLVDGGCREDIGASYCRQD